MGRQARAALKESVAEPRVTKGFAVFEGAVLWEEKLYFLIA
jgi:hypothetical protein